MKFPCKVKMVALKHNGFYTGEFDLTIGREYIATGVGYNEGGVWIRDDDDGLNILLSGEWEIVNEE